MYPTVVHFGSFSLSSLVVAAGLGFVVGGFVFWRRLKNFGLSEESSLELYFRSLTTGLIGARLVYIFTHLTFFSTNLYRWFHFFRYPGFSFWGFGIGFMTGLKLFSREQKFSYWRLADEVIFSLAWIGFFLSVGFFLVGRELGTQTSFFWGVYYPGDMIRRHPVALIQAGLYAGLGAWVLWSERRWRFWRWYKSQKEGFLVLSTIILASLGEGVLAFLKPIGVYSWITTQLVFGVIGVIAAAAFYRRSGRKQLVAFSRKKYKLKS